MEFSTLVGKFNMANSAIKSLVLQVKELSSNKIGMLKSLIQEKLSGLKVIASERFINSPYWCHAKASLV